MPLALYWQEGGLAVKIKTKTRQITLGELVVRIMDAVTRVARDERDAYRISGFVLNRILCPVPEVSKQRVIRWRAKTRIL